MEFVKKKKEELFVNKMLFATAHKKIMDKLIVSGWTSREKMRRGSGLCKHWKIARKKNI